MVYIISGNICENQVDGSLSCCDKLFCVCQQIVDNLGTPLSLKPWNSKIQLLLYSYLCIQKDNHND